jgi:hypothetical protein
MRARLQEIKAQLRSGRHKAIPEQGRWLRAAITGLFAYHALPTNSRALSASVTQSEDAMTWERVAKLAACPNRARTDLCRGRRAILRPYRDSSMKDRRILKGRPPSFTSASLCASSVVGSSQPKGGSCGGLEVALGAAGAPCAAGLGRASIVAKPKPGRQATLDRPLEQGGASKDPVRELAVG